MRTDINAFIGPYPWRDVGPTDPAALAASLAAVGVTDAWVSHLPSVFWKDPASGNEALRAACAPFPHFRPVPAVHPGMPGWRAVLTEARAAGAPCVRCDPHFHGIAPIGTEMQQLVVECAALGLPLMMAVKLEDGRQRHPLDTVADLQPWAVRTLVRADPGVKLIITHADREFIEQVHFGSTPAEADRLLWDICWIWGPPEDHLELLLETIGPDRFAFGSGAPLRIPDNSAVKLELLDLPAEVAALLDHRNARSFIAA